MAEQYDLTTPVTPPTIASYQVREFYTRYDPPTRSGYYAIIIPKQGGAQITYAVNDSVENNNLATSRIKTLNTANLTTNSLQRRVLNLAAQDGALPPGTVTGTPDV